MERQAVTSSNISSIGYDSNSSILEIEFNKGGVYEYFDVPQYVYDGLMSASSHGKYANDNIYKNYRQNRKG
jgi:uncharacterized protein